MAIRFLVDECIADDIATFLRNDREHDVTHVLRVPELRGKADAELAAIAQQHEMVVVTANAKHFRDLAIKLQRGGKPKFPSLSVITIEVVATMHYRRLVDEIDLAEFRYASLRRAGKRMVMRIQKTRVSFEIG